MFIFEIDKLLINHLPLTSLTILRGIGVIGHRGQALDEGDIVNVFIWYRTNTEIYVKRILTRKANRTTCSGLNFLKIASALKCFFSGYVLCINYKGFRTRLVS